MNTALITLLLAAAAPFPSLAGPGEGDVSYVDASFWPEGELLDRRFVDLDGDGRLSLCLAVRLPDGGRELQLHRAGPRGFSETPELRIPVLEDVLAYGFADVREEAGQELIFLTRSGAFCTSTQRAGLRGNIQRLVSAELLYDVPDPHSLPFWRYVLPRAGGDLLVLPQRRGFALFGPRAARNEAASEPGEPLADPREALYEPWTDFGNGEPAARPWESFSRHSERKSRIEVGNGMRIDMRNSSDLFIESGEDSRYLLRDGKAYRAPALVDIDADGERDLVVLAADSLRVHLFRDGSFSALPSRIESFPEYLRTDEDQSLSLRFADLDGDGQPDLLGQLRREAEGFENSTIQLFVLLNDGRRLLPQTPTQLLRFEAAFVRVRALDVDGDGAVDLAMQKFALPSLMETVSGLEFTLTHLLFPGTGKRAQPFERKPALKLEQRFDEESVGDAVANRHLELDCDGDGIPDLVEVDLQGRIAVRRLRHESSFFGGTSWSLDTTPWKRFEARGSITNLAVLDLNGDGLGDIASQTDRSLTILLSSRSR